MVESFINFPSEKGELLYAVMAGSKSYGTDTPESDTDIWGVYSQNHHSILMGEYTPLIEVSKDEKYYEISNFLDKICGANPTTLEMLFVPERSILYVSDLFKELLKIKEQFLTKKMKQSFGNYAIKQIQKSRGLNKKQNWEEEKTQRKDILDFCWVLVGDVSVPCKKFLQDNGFIQENVGLSAIPNFPSNYNLYYDDSGKIGFRGILNEKSNDIRLSSIPKYFAQNNKPFILTFNLNAYSVHCKEYREYLKWLEERNENRYVDFSTHGQKYDGKNLLHCVRLIRTVSEIPKFKTIRVDRRGIDADYLLSIKRGKVNLETIIKDSESTITELNKMYEKSDLPETVEKGVYEKWLSFFRFHKNRKGNSADISVL